jgi:hypothetical protein
MALTKSQEKFLAALTDNMGILSKAARACNQTRQNHYDWLGKSEEYKQAYEQVIEERNDFIEDCLLQRIIEGDADNILIHLAKTVLRSRGYGEKIEVDHSNTPVPVNIQVEITNDVRGDKNKV